MDKNLPNRPEALYACRKTVQLAESNYQKLAKFSRITACADSEDLTKYEPRIAGPLIASPLASPICRAGNVRPARAIRGDWVL